MLVDESGFELVREGEIRQARQFPRALLRDSRLSFGARGIFAYLWDLPIGWRIRAVHLSAVGPQRRDAVRGLLRELEAVGALRTEVVRGEKGRLEGKRWILSSPHLWAIESPLSRRESPEAAPEKDFTEGRENQSSDNPIFGKSGAKVLTKIKESSSSSTEKISPPDSAPNSLFEIRHGIVTWTQEDRSQADDLVAAFGVEAIAGAIERLEVAEKEPLPSRVRREAERAARAERVAKKKAKIAEPTQKAHLNVDPAAQAIGLKMLGQHGKSIINKIQKGIST